MPAFSHSRITSFENCPLHYKYQYIDHVEVEKTSTVEAFLGSRVHESLQRLYQDLRFEKPMSLDNLLADFNSRWDKNWDDTVLIVRQEYTAENYRKMGERYLRDYYERYKPFRDGNIIGLETQDFLSLDEAGKYTFHIRIDRLTDMGSGLYEVHDYKTGMELSGQESLDKDRQLAMYSLWVRRRFKDFKKVRLVWHFLAHDKEMESFRTAAELEELRKKVLASIQDIEATQDFAPHASALCRWCLYRNLCPLRKHGTALEQKSENEFLDDPGVRLVDEYVKIKEEQDKHKKESEDKLSKLREALILFCQREGVEVVFGSDSKVTVKPYEQWKLPAKNTQERVKLLELLKGIGKLDEVSDLDLNILVRILKGREWADEELFRLEEFVTRELTYRLSISKK